MNNDDLIAAEIWVTRYYGELASTPYGVLRAVQANAFRAAAKMVKGNKLIGQVVGHSPTWASHNLACSISSDALLTKAIELEAQNERTNKAGD